MKRIGKVASRIAKDNFLLYNVSVVVISILCSLFIFVIAGSTVLFSLVILDYIGQEIMAFDIEKSWPIVLKVCMGTLTIVVTLITLMAIIINVKGSHFSKEA